MLLWWKEVVMTVERVRVSFFRERKRWRRNLLLVYLLYLCNLL
ncbi:hypothetical protein HanXRQr2_Chr17g0810741 [Helianthus annuus]|uniref:Uncharacterized protein n=1 Tax=Helianthus annuus TaxID=4232 RepID=A0A9K3DK03_HELAN|nr:hypothetical protein HanXRQr2_Chr17g0810741 [Helianthus annuus]